MPGIAGIIGTGSPGENESMLQRMVKCMMHEPFYKSGTYVNDSSGIWVGWVNHENAFSDCMPGWNEDKDVCLIFSGENFTDSIEIERLKLKNHNFYPQNASYLVHYYEEEGTQFLQKLNGWFSGILIDLRKPKISLFNDRYGLGRIYYFEKGGKFYFSSEAKSLLKVIPELRELSLQGLAETFSCGCVLQNRTLFSKISLLPGGSAWTFQPNGQIRKESYFDPNSWEQQKLLSEAEFNDRLSETFARILPKYLNGRQKVAMSLTGGLDGRMIMAWANRPPGGLPCYTFGGSYRDCTDVKIASRVARLCQQSHETIVVGSKFLTEFPRFVEKSVFVSDGAMDVTGAVELYVNRIARQVAPVRLTGNYGSEIVRGNVAFKPGSLYKDGLAPEFATLVRKASNTYNYESQGHKLTFIAFKQVPWHHYSRLSVEQSQITMRSPFLDNEIVSLMYQAPENLFLSRAPTLRLIADGNVSLSRIPTDRGLLYQPIPIITKWRNFYQEFTFKAEYAYDYGMPQWLTAVDNLLSPLHIERVFLGRHKFHHFRVWYRDGLHQYLREVLLDTRTLNRPYFDGKRIEELVNNHIEGNRNYTSEIHRILTSELTQRHLIEQI